MKTSRYLPLLALLFTLLNLTAQESRDIRITSGKEELEGTLITPENFESGTVVLLVAGSGPTDRNGNNPAMQNNSLKLLAQGLAAEEIASLRYDKRGVGNSTRNTAEAELRFGDFVTDASAWIATLKADPRFKKIVVLGHSEGSLVGMLASLRSGADAFISVAGPGRPASELIRDQLAAQPKEITALTGPMLDRLQKGDTVGAVPPWLNSLFRPSVQPYLISWFRFDPASTFAALDLPKLIIQGTNDLQVPEKDARLLAKADDKAGIIMIEGMNHILKEVSGDRQANMMTYNAPDKELHPDLLPVVVKFIKGLSQ